MTSHHVTCHVTAVSHASSSSKRKIKETRKENQYKIRKIKEKKNKIVSIQVSHNIWQALHSLFNSVQNHQINLDLLEEIPNKHVMKWMLFSKEEFKSFITKRNNSSMLGMVHT